MSIDLHYQLQEALALRKKSQEERARVQGPLLAGHLRRAKESPFYARLLADCHPEEIKTPADLAGLPFTTRADLDSHGHEIGLMAPELVRDISLTSGTTGEPVLVPYTEPDLLRLAFNEAIAFASAGVVPGDRVMLTVTLDRCFIAGLAYYSGVTMLGASAIRSGPGQPASQWQLLERLRPRVLVGVPSFLLELGRWGAANGKKPGTCPVDTIVTIGEPVRQANFELTASGQELAAIWQAKLFASYGATELQTAFGECRSGAGGHVHPELMVVEIVDDHGNILPHGVPGEVVVTPLGVQGFPLVRFRTGDVARLHDGQCACGWQTSRLGPLEGRLAQRLKFRGTTLYPESIFHGLQQMPGVDEILVEVRDSGEGGDLVTVVVGSSGAELTTVAISDRLQSVLRVRPEVVLRPLYEVRQQVLGHGGRKAKRFFDFRG